MTVTEIEPITLAEIGSAICAATEEVFSVMLGIDVAAGEAQPGGSQDHSGVVAVLGLTGEWGGAGQVSCDAGLALAIASRLLMVEYVEVDEEVLDAIAEVANMIVGNVKTAIERTLGAMGMSTPAVFFGGDFETRVVGKPNMVLVPFTCRPGDYGADRHCAYGTHQGAKQDSETGVALAGSYFKACSR